MVSGAPLTPDRLSQSSAGVVRSSDSVSGSNSTPVPPIVPPKQSQLESLTATRPVQEMFISHIGVVGLSGALTNPQFADYLNDRFDSGLSAQTIACMRSSISTTIRTISNGTRRYAVIVLLRRYLQKVEVHVLCGKRRHLFVFYELSQGDKETSHQTISTLLKESVLYA